MSAEIVALKPKGPRRRRLRTPVGSLALERAIRSIARAQDELRSRRYRRTKVAEILDWAKEDLLRALASEHEEARADLATDLDRALGPEITMAGVNGAREVLTLILRALPNYGSGGEA
jgi:hypothetical protein